VVQFRCAADVAVPAREPFVIRLPSPPRTIGGGRILHPLAARHRRTDARIADALRWLIAAEPPAIVRRQLQDAGWQGRPLGDLAQFTGFAPSRVAGWAAAAGAEIVDGVAIDGTAFRALCEHMRRAIDGFHRRFPREPGMSLDRLLAALPEPPSLPVVRAAVAHLARQGSIVQEQGRLRRRDVDPGGNLAPADAEAAHAVEAAFRKAGLAPPEAPAAETQRWAVRHLLRRGALIRTVDRVQKREILFHRDAVAHARRLIAAHFSSIAGFTVGDAGRVLGISR
jgi:selenocysteine-specific elongation factor